MEKDQNWNSQQISMSGQVAIITEGRTRFGLSCASELLARGAKVVLNLGCVRSVESCPNNWDSQIRGMVDALQFYGGQLVTCSADITDPVAVADMVDLVMKKWGRVDILVTNSDSDFSSLFLNTASEDLSRTINYFLLGTIHCIKAVWEPMCANEFGRIVIATSSTGLFGTAGFAAIGAAEMGLVGLMQSLAIEGYPLGIHVNCLALGVDGTATLGRFGNLDEQTFINCLVVGLIYLASSEGPTKQILCVGPGTYSVSNVTLTDGIYIGRDACTPEALLTRERQLVDRRGDVIPTMDLHISEQI